MAFSARYMGTLGMVPEVTSSSMMSASKSLKEMLLPEDLK